MHVISRSGWDDDPLHTLHAAPRRCRRPEFRRDWNSPEFHDLSQRLMAILKPIRFRRTLGLAIHENQELMRAAAQNPSMASWKHGSKAAGTCKPRAPTPNTRRSCRKWKRFSPGLWTSPIRYAFSPSVKIDDAAMT